MPMTIGELFDALIADMQNGHPNFDNCFEDSCLICSVRDCPHKNCDHYKRRGCRECKKVFWQAKIRVESTDPEM
jgi:hypothetical protein